MHARHIEVQSSATTATALFRPSSLALITALHDRFADRLQQLLNARTERQLALDAGEWPTSLPVGKEAEWTITRMPQALRDRRVELHCVAAEFGVGEAFSGGASTRVMDLEELLPVPGAALQAQAALYDSLRTQPAAAAMPVVFGPRSLSARDDTLRWDTRRACAALVDIALYLDQRAATSDTLCVRLSQLESVAEAELWRDIFRYFETSGTVTRGQINTTLAIETVPALFDIESIMHTLVDYTVAVTLDRYACLGSFVRSFRCFPQFILPDRNELMGNVHFLRCWELLLVQHAHRRQASAIASCALTIAPANDDSQRTARRLRALVERHAHAGFDGCGVADVQSIAIAREVFDRLMPGPHQQHRLRDDVYISGADLLQVPKGKITESGMRLNLEIALLGLYALENGETTLTIKDCRETPASIELAAAQLRHWVRHATGVLDNGRIVDRDYFEQLLADVVQKRAAAAALPAGLTGLLTDYVLGSAEPAGLLTK